LFKKSESPKQLIKLTSRPLLTDLAKWCQDCVRARDKSITVIWNSQDNMCSYSLVINSVPGSSDPQWRMSSQSGSMKKDLWFYISNDVNNIFSMCVNALGENLSDAIAADAIAVAQTNTSSGQSGAAPAATAPDNSSMASQQRGTGPLPIASPASPTELLTGNLAVLHITNLLQSVSMGKMTGRLHIEPTTGPVDVFFEAGSPVHALSRQASGEEAFLEVVALNNGSFIFEPNLKTDTRTITRTLDSLILKGIQILDCQAMIDAAGVTLNSVVHRTQQGLSEAAFEQKISEGAPIDMALQKKFYISIDGQSTVRQLVENLKLPRSEWIPLLSNLVKVGLAGFTTAGPGVKKTVAVQPKRLDSVVVEQYAHQIKKADTGAIPYQGFQYYLQQEYLRYKRFESPFSVILIDVRCQKPGGPVTRGMLNPATVLSVVQNINLLKRELDLITHYEGQSLALILPHTHAHEAAVLARRAVTSINEAKFMQGMERLIVSIVTGIASIPGDVETPGELLAAAEMAKEKAINTPDGVQLFSDLS